MATGALIFSRMNWGARPVEALVPNSTFLENQVVNWTYSNPRIRREIRIGIAYGSPVRKAAEIITGCAAEHGLVLDNPTPEVFLEDFADSAILMALIFWVEMTPTLLPGADRDVLGEVAILGPLRRLQILIATSK